MNKHLSILAAGILACFVVACGGGGGESSTTPTATPVPATPTVTPVPATPVPTLVPGTVAKGVYLDAAIEGIEYTSASKSGVTNSKGEFEYVVGEEITFKMYGKVINTSRGDSVITPSDMADIDIHKVLNVLMLAQALDEDQDPSNGIKLPTIDWTKVVSFTKSDTGHAGTKTMQEWWDDVDFGIDSRDVSHGAGADYLYDNRIVLASAQDPINIFLRVVYPDRLMTDLETAVKHFSDTIGSVSSGVLFDLRGKTATSRVVVTGCEIGTDLVGVRTYTFGETSFTKVGQTINSRYSGTGYTAKVECYLFDNSANDGLLDYARPDAAASSIPCGPTCTYNQVNQVTAYRANDVDSTPQYVSLTWYNKEAKTITRIKMFVIPNLRPAYGTDGRYVRQTWKEVITFND